MEIAILGGGIGSTFGQPLGDLPGDRGRGAVALEQVEGGVVGPEIEQVHHLVKHLAMLAGGADTAVETRIAPKRMEQRKQLDRFGTRAEHRQNAPPAPHMAAA